ncbi:MAG: lysylphosphatidylglycerol synthase transmembrane domain-containing protein [Phycisphaerales bacterium]|jgi:hypothetical protein|nr:lysylphosphatidylglycerol synthase transmembrane domain-containing protein [Phycisphaerales bacterium]
MNRHVFTVVRLLLVTIGVTVIVFAVNWQTLMVVPAGEPGFGGETAEVARTFVVTLVEPAGAGAVLVHTENGLGGEVTTNWIRRGIFDIFASADWWWVLVGLGLVGCIYPLQATRWWLLMRCRGLAAPWPRTLRLVYIGAFSNFFLPGTEGGDVVKAWGATRGSERRVEAVMSVVFDRITGLAGLVLLAAGVGIFAAESNTARDIGWWTAGSMLLIAVVAIGAFFVTTRGWLRMPEVAKTFGGGLPTRLLAAGKAYAKHPGPVIAATGVSVCVQILLASAAGACAWALGATHDISVILAVMPILFLAAAVPLTWQGAGVMEVLGIALLAMPGVATVNQVVGFLLLYRSLELSWGLVGAALMLGGGISLHPERQQAAS